MVTYHFSPIILAKIQKLTKNCTGKTVGKHSYLLLVARQNGTTTGGEILAVDYSYIFIYPLTSGYPF